MSSIAAQVASFLDETQRDFPDRDFTWIAVSKTHPYSVLREAYLSGVRIFGENYIPEAIEKFTQLFSEFPESRAQIQLHHIGRLQSGTLRKLFGFFYATHGVGSFSSARELKKRADKEKLPIHFFLQCNISGEDSKNGLELSEIQDHPEWVQEIQSEFCIWEGFMGMGPSNGDLETTRTVFQNLVQFRDQNYPEKKLSLGMSNDYKVALELGSDCIRIGSRIFGQRG